MKEERRFVYTLILAVCIVLSAILVGKTVASLRAAPSAGTEASQQPDTDGENAAQSLSFTQDELQTLASDLSGQALTLTLRAPDGLTLSADLPRDSLLALLNGCGVSLPAPVQRLLPQSVTLGGSFTLSCPTPNTLVFTPEKLTASGVSLPDAAAQSLGAQLSQAVSEALGKNGAAFTDVRIAGDTVYLEN
jgi:hypothetical protein